MPQALLYEKYQVKTNLFFLSRRTLSIPVAEMITNSNTTMSLTYFLGRVKEACIKMDCRIVQPVRIEFEFSWPLINSFLLVFSSGNMVKHLHSCWKTLCKKDIIDNQTDYTVVQICYGLLSIRSLP